MRPVGFGTTSLQTGTAEKLAVSMRGIWKVLMTGRWIGVLLTGAVVMVSV